MLVVFKFSPTHRAKHIKEAKNVLLESWGIRDKTQTDHASNMTL